MGVKKRGGKQKLAFIRFMDKVSFLQIFTFWIIMSINFGLGYFLVSTVPGNELAYGGVLIQPDLDGVINSVYYSFITVTTTGYGDIRPHGLSKLFAVCEVIFGVLIQGLVVSKLVSFKQEAILEEIYDINYEEAFTNYRRGLALARTDILMMIEKVESGTIKPREIKDLWVIFSGLDQSLNNIKALVIPPKNEAYYLKPTDSAKFELILNSMRLSMNKENELIKTMKSHNVDWREELLMSSLNYEIQTCREIIEYEIKRVAEPKVIDKINTFKAIIDDIEAQLNETEKKEEPAPQKNEEPPKKSPEEKKPEEPSETEPDLAEDEEDAQARPKEAPIIMSDPRLIEINGPPGTGEKNTNLDEYL